MNLRSESVTQAIWYATVLWCGLLVGTSFAHALEMSAKLEMPPDLWLQLQRSLYTNYATAGAVAELGSIVLAATLAARLRDSAASLSLAMTGLCSLVLAFFAVWLGFTLPVSRQTGAWTVDAIPSDWEVWRRQWEYSHLGRFVLHLAAFAAVAAVPTVTRRRRTVYTRPHLVVNAAYTVVSDPAGPRATLRARRRGTT